MKRRSVVALLLLSFTVPRVLHAQTNDPVALIRSAVDEALVVLRDPALRKPEKRGERLARLRAVADRIFDWVAMAQSSLGARYRSASEAQRAEFVALFKELIAQDYRDDLDRFMGDEKVLVKGVEAREELRLVKTVLITHSRDQVPLDYLMRQDGQTWRAVDFSVEGVSLVNHYRKSFGRFLDSHGFDELLARLRSRAKAR
jgi:phospholipid transport system substrate-binding protein